MVCQYFLLLRELWIYKLPIFILSLAVVDIFINSSLFSLQIKRHRVRVLASNINVVEIVDISLYFGYGENLWGNLS